MKKLYALMATLALFAGAGMVLADAEWSGTGEIIELGCYKSQNASGEGHAACAKKCLSDGKEMGLLKADGSIVAMQTVVADLDGDTDMDVAAVGLFDRNACTFCSPGKVSWYENPGDVFTAWTEHSLTTNLWGARFIAA